MIPSAMTLSPRYMTKGEPSRNFSEISTACARPRGASCGMYVIRAPKREPSPRAASISGRVSPTTTPISEIPAATIASTP